MAVKRTPSVARAKAPAKSAKPASQRSASDQRASATRGSPAKRGKVTPAKRGKVTPAKRGKVTPAKRGKVAPAKRAKVTPAKRGKATAAMFQKVAFTMFSVEDPMRARGFYEEVLGLARGLASADGTWTEYDLPGGGCLALFRHPDPKFARPPGGASVALEVADLDELNERLKQAGVRYQGDVVHGPHCRMCNILDSEGNALILHQLNRD